MQTRLQMQRHKLVAIAAPALALFVFSAAPLAAGQHVVDQSTLERTAADRAAGDQATRDALVNVLGSAEARNAAARLGLDLQDARTAVDMLDTSELAQLAGPAQAAQADLAGGADTIVISTTTLLLILIIVILLAS
jgi:hypothetical protein